MKNMPTASRAAATNRTRLIPPGVDGRSVHGRRLRDLILKLAAEHGGVDALTEMQLSTIQMMATTLCAIEALQPRVVTGQPAAMNQLTRLNNTLRRLSAALEGQKKATEPKAHLPSAAGVLAEINRDA